MIKFNNLYQKIFAGYSVFISVILIQVFLSYYTNKNAQKTFHKLSSEIKPNVELLNKYRNANRILLLLVNNKVAESHSGHITGKIKQLSKVHFPYFKEELSKLVDNYKIKDYHKQKIDSIIINTKSLLIDVDNINSLLTTFNDYNKNKPNLGKAMRIVRKATALSTNIDYKLALLQKDYNRDFEQGYLDLSRKIENSFNILLITTLFFIILGLIFSHKIAVNITFPLKKLMVGVKQISEGKYNNKVKVYGNDQIAELTKIFNKMSTSLNNSFNDIKKKNKELEQFTYITSHDLQEPLLTLRGFVKLLNENYGEQFDEVGKKSLAYINEASERMSNLVKALLDHGRIGNKTKLTQVNCNLIIEDIKDDLASTIKESGATFKIDKLPILNGYKTELRLLFQNLISNSIKFRKSSINPIITITVKEENGWTFTVKDNGIGFDQKHEDRIFSVFQRLHYEEKYKGTGIGLAHCYKIIDLHQGKIWVKSSPNKGTTFYFKIPNIII